MPATERAPTDLPPIVFVARKPLPPSAGGGVPGLGPRQRAAAGGGKLLVRSPSGKITTLVPPSKFFDVSDPCPSWDGRRVVFAGLARRDSAWRIWVVGADGRDLRPLTRTDRAIDLSPLGADASRWSRYDDLDPCWLPDGRVVFASTRFPWLAEDGGLATNLWVVSADGGRPERVTHERNGADEPTIDPRSGRIVFARWWTNRFLASESTPSGLTTDRALAVPSDRIDLWHAATITPDGDGIRLAGGNARVRAQTMAYQPLVLEDGTLIGVEDDSTSLVPKPSRPRLVVFAGGFAEPAYPTLQNERAALCSPAWLPDGRILVSLDAEGRGDFGLYAMRRDGAAFERVVDAKGTLELDGAALVARPVPPIVPEGLDPNPRSLPPTRVEDVQAPPALFRFDCLNVFTNAPIDVPIPDAPPVARGLRIRFYAALARPSAAGADSAILVREAEVTTTGGVHEDVTPADTPMFEQLVDAHGHVLRSASGPAHVPGFNSGRFGSGTKCVGCHLGHSAIAVAQSYQIGKRFNASTSARATASSEVSSAKQAIDRRTRGTTERVAWIANPEPAASIRLAWPMALAVDSLIVYGVRPDPEHGTDVRVDGCEVRLLRDGRLARRLRIDGVLSPDGSRVDCGSIEVDAAEIVLGPATGNVNGRAATGLAEIETRARIPER
jgi:hypothetical protein